MTEAKKGVGGEVTTDMTDNLSVRPMYDQDIFELCREAPFDDLFAGIKYATLDDFSFAFASRRVWLVAFLGVRPVGLASLLVSDDGGSIGLWNLSVHRDLQGLGYGRSLAEAVFAYAVKGSLSLSTGSYTPDGEERLRPILESLAASFPSVAFSSGV